MDIITTDKIAAAKQQLIQAIKCIFRGDDMLAVHTLAAASRQLLSDLCKDQKVHRDIEDSNDYKKLDKETQKKLNQAIRKPQNFMKHADKDPQAELIFNAKLTELFIHDACQLYRSITGSLFSEGAIYQAWMYKKHPDDFGGIIELQKLFPGIAAMPEPSEIEAYYNLL